MPVSKRVKLVVDTNVLLSALIGGSLRWFVRVLDDDRFEILLSPGLLEELQEVLGRPGFRKWFPMEATTEVLSILSRHATLVDIGPPYPAVCRDPKDDRLLAVAKVGRADLLVTGDQDQLVLGKHGRTRILKPASFRDQFL